MSPSTSIIAISSPPGDAARGLIRLSGQDAKAVVTPHLSDFDPNTRKVIAGRLVIAGIDVPVISFNMPGPASFTTEDIVELQLPGNQLLLKRVMQGLIDSATERGLPLLEAGPGEFTYRAWLHGRLPLDQAEAIAAIIAAQSDQELIAARHVAEGSLHLQLHPVAATLTQTLALIEAGIDFSDEEDVVIASVDQLTQQLRGACDALTNIQQSTTGAESPDVLPRIVLRGPANAGKSTLFNALLGRERVIVHDEAGTTRDAIVEPCLLHNDVSVLLVDTPGDESARLSPAAIAEEESDLVVWCVPCDVWQDPPMPAVRLGTKRDTTHKRPDCDLCISAHEPTDIDAVAAFLSQAVTSLHRSQYASRLALSTRQWGLLDQATERLHDAISLLDLDPPTGSPDRPSEVAAEVRESINHIGHIIGTIAPDDVLGVVFASFCVGK